MNNLRIPFLTLVTLLSLLYLHISGMENHLYLNYWFYDIMMHILGGVCIALSVFYIANTFNISIIKKYPSLIIVIGFIGGLLWEAFELQYGIAGHDFGTYLYNFDTVKDLIDDTLGAVLVWFLIVRNKKI